MIEQNLLDYSPPLNDDMFIESYTHNILSQKEGQVVYLHYFMGYSIADIAKIFGISRQAVNNEKMRALQKIIKKLNAEIKK